MASLLAGALAVCAMAVQAHAAQEDACAPLSRAEAEAVLSAAVADGSASVQNLARECSYETVPSASRRMVLAFSVYETGRAGLRGSAADYFAAVRRTSMHLGMPMHAVEVGDEAYWMGGALHVRKGQDLSLAIEIVGAAAEAADAADSEPALALSVEAAAIILGKLDAPTPTREILTIATNTQAHREDLRIAVGNIWQESYTPDGSAPRTGLTAMLDMGVPQDASRRQRVRVHAGQTLRAFGYLIQITSIERSRVRLTVDRDVAPR